MNENSKFDVRIEGDAAVVTTTGYINNTLADAFARRCEELAADGIRHIVLNMSKSRMVNSVGIAIIVEVIEKMQDRGGSFGFSSVSPTVAKTFQIMGLLQLVSIYETDAAAIQAPK